VPGLPLQGVVDPTGAGDAFAGGFLGYLAATDDLSAEGLRRATIYGSAMGSFCCESFSVDRLAGLTADDIDERYRAFRELTRFPTHSLRSAGAGLEASPETLPAPPPAAHGT
jgi:pfkB family carbohydrate kinase